jgi:hypothetical protein
MDAVRGRLLIAAFIPDRNFIGRVITAQVAALLGRFTHVERHRPHEL